MKIALIPARSGSKGIPHKNVIQIAGKPLISWTIKAALEAQIFDEVIVSTDCPSIQHIATNAGAKCPFLRPKAASSDTSTALDVIEHFVEWSRTNYAQSLTLIAYLQPTSPLRTAKHLCDAYTEFLKHKEASSLVSVIRVPHNFIPSSIMYSDEKYLRFQNNNQSKIFTRQQKKNNYFARNGPAILFTLPDTIQGGSIYGAKIVPFEMDAYSSYDIDEEKDLRFVELLLLDSLGDL